MRNSITIWNYGQDIIDDKFKSDMVKYTSTLGKVHEDVTFYDMKDDYGDKKVDVWVDMPSFDHLVKVRVNVPVHGVVRVMVKFQVPDETPGIRAWEITHRFPVEDVKRIYRFAAFMVEMGPDTVVFQDLWLNNDED